MTEGVTNSEPISFEMPPISEAQVAAFRQATRTANVTGVPATFATLFRKGEFAWVDRLETNVQAVLHAEQEYEYLAPLAVGDRPLITTSLKNLRARSGMIFLVLESRVSCGDEAKIVAHTTFVVRDGKASA